jgi:hypothetical protein
MMFVKLNTKKINSTLCQGLWKEQSKILRFTKLRAEKEAQATATPSKERRAREQKKWNLLNLRLFRVLYLYKVVLR